ncbi:hypothetical protein [Flammeovirga sp. OC4]|uniref:hypothetical protein n=1 Tax=Flammeovirga sp. OC4 TaxID=1382345 RepID=UPI0005C4DBDF|nr:hypothetical protein [Flammeovirga sp. OC4]
MEIRILKQLTGPFKYGSVHTVSEKEGKSFIRLGYAEDTEGVVTKEIAQSEFLEDQKEEEEQNQEDSEKEIIKQLQDEYESITGKDTRVRTIEKLEKMIEYAKNNS